MTGRQLGRFEWEAELVKHPGIPLPLRGFVMTLATYATTTTGRDIRPSLTSLSRALGIDRSTASRHAADAVRMGWLTVVEDNRAHGKPSVYALSVPFALPQECGTPLGTDAAGGDADMHRGVLQECGTTSTETSATTSPDTSTEDDPWAGLDDEPWPAGGAVEASGEVIEEEDVSEAELAEAPEPWLDEDDDEPVAPTVKRPRSGPADPEQAAADRRRFRERWAV